MSGNSRKVLKNYTSNSDSPVAQIVKSAYGDFTGHTETARDVMTGALNQEYALQSMERANEYNIQAEERANEYNSIGSQMQRARDAGVSELAALGQSTGQTISSVSPVAGTTPRSASRSARANEIAQMTIGAISQGLDIYKEIAEVRNLNQNTKLQLSQTQHQEIRNEIAEATKTTTINIERAKEKGINIENEQKQFDYYMSQISAPIDLEQKRSNVKKAWAETFSIYEKTKIDRDLADSQLSLNDTVMLLNCKKSGFLDVQSENVKADTQLKGAQYLLTLSEAELKNVVKELTLTQKDAQSLMNDIQSFRNDFEKEHKSEEWRLHKKRVNQQVITGYLDSSSKVMQSLCMVVGTIATRGKVGALAGATPNTTSSVGSLADDYGYNPYYE